MGDSFQESSWTAAIIIKNSKTHVLKSATDNNKRHRLLHGEETWLLHVLD
jgi:hypothetical protein